MSNDNRRAIIIALAGFACAVSLILLSDGTYEDYDDLAHFQRAAWSWIDARHLVDDWGRPGLTLLLFLPAGLGHVAARITSAAMSAGAAYFAFGATRRLGVARPWIAAALVWLQPLFFVLSMTTMTETAAALYLSVALWALLAGRPMLSASVMSMTLTTRYEFVIFLPIWIVALWLRRPRGLAAMPLLIWAPLVHNLAAAADGARLPILLYFGAQHAAYPSGDVFAYFGHFVDAAGFVIAVLAVAGAIALWRRRDGWLVGVMIAAFLAIQTWLHVRSAFASGGYARFVVAIAPVVGVAAAAGWQTLCAAVRKCDRQSAGALLFGFAFVYVGLELHRYAAGIWWDALFIWLYRATAALVLIALLARRQSMIAALRTVAVVLIAARFLFVAEPLRMTPHQREIAAAIDFANRHDLHCGDVLSADPWPDEFTGRRRPADYAPFRDRLTAAAPGDLALWNEYYGTDQNTDVPLCRMLLDADEWELEWAAAPRPGHWPSILLFRRLH